jgi:adenylate cyclase
VVVEEHDIFGDGVNVAARLEALAEPGGVFVSNTVHDHVPDWLPSASYQAGATTSSQTRRNRVFN